MTRIASQNPESRIGGGEMGKLIRSFDWSKTRLGSSDEWSPSLKTAVQIMLNSRYPMFIWWGCELIHLYNDGYIPILGARHPSALGESAPKVWSEIWKDVGPLADIVLREGRATWNEELPLFMERHGFLEECYFTFSYSPITDGNGSVGGVFCACSEDTRRVIGERRLQTLRALGERSLSEARNVQEACRTAAKTIAENPKDMPFALIYQLAEDGKTAQFCDSSQLLPDLSIAPQSIQLGDAKEDIWFFQQVLDANKPLIIEHLEEKFGKLPAVPWQNEWTRKAVVLPLAKSGNQELPAGFLVTGISPRLFYDNDYAGYIELVAGHIATAIANARAMEEERRRAQALYELDLAKTAFFSNVSHEFRTPLTLLLAPLEDMLQPKSGALPDEQRKQLEIAHRNALRLLKLVNNLLDFSRIQSNRIEASFELQDLAALTTDLAGSFRSAIENAGLDFIIETPMLSEPVYVDQEMWEKIVLNLLSNAFKYTLEGQIILKLQEKNGQVILSVQDTGVGIPAAELDNIFKRFHRVPNTRGRTHEGTGIGLSLVQELTQFLGGNIQVQSQEGVGSTFTVAIPLRKSHTNSKKMGTPSFELPVSSSAMTYRQEALHWLPNQISSVDSNQASLFPPWAGSEKKPLLLVADDNADMRNYLHKLLVPYYQVETVNNGEAAWQSILRRVPDLVLSDVMMPKMDGIALLKKIKEDPKTATLPVVLLSARVGEDARLTGLDTGADDYIIKPFSAKELLTRINTQLRITETRTESQKQLNELFMQAPALISILRGREGRCELFNPLFSQMWGHRDVLGKTMREAWPELEGQGWFEIVEKVFETGKAIYGNEYPAVADWNNDGHLSEAFFNFVYAPYLIDNQVDGVMIFGFEVTEQVIARKKVEKSEEALRNMIMQAPVSIAILRGKNYLFEIINEDYSQLVDKSIQDLIGVPLLEALPELQSQPIKGVLDDVIQTGEPFFGREYPVVLNRGGQNGTAYFNFVYQPLREHDGSISGIMAVANEVTEQVIARKQVEESEERYRTLFESMDEGFCVIEMIFDQHNNPVDYRFLEINPTFENQTGLRNAIGKTISELVPNLEAHWFEMYGKVALTGESVRFTDESEAMHRAFDVYAYRIGGANSQKVGVLFSDISERKRAEKALYKSNQFNQDVLDSLAEHLAVINQKGVITAINEAWRRFAVQNGADWTMRGVGVGINYLEVCHVKSDPEAMLIYEGIKSVLDGDRDFFSVEYPCHSPTMKRWFLLSVSPLSHDDGGAVISHLNITTRRLAEEALRQSEERLRIATDSAELGTWDFDIASGKLVWDKRTKELFGLPPEAPVDYEIFLQGLHEEDRATTHEIVQATIRGENQGLYDIQYRTVGIENRKLRWIRAKGKAFFNESGEAYRFIGTVLDVTERKIYEDKLLQSEELFRNMADTVPMMIWMTQADGNCTYLNRQWYGYTGQTPEIGLGYGWLDAVHPQDSDNSGSIFMNANRQQIPFHFEYRLKDKKGNYRWMLDAGSPRFNTMGEFEGFIGVVVDIHDRKIAEEQKDAFMRIAGHELRTPLTSLVGYLSLMLKAPENTEMVTNFAKKGYESALKMRGLITDFLDFSKAQKGTLTFQTKEFDFDTLVADTVENMQFSFPQHQIVLEGSTGKKIRGDYGRIEQVLTNLLHNAMKYSPGQDRIDVLLETKDGKVLLRVRDYGLGIAPKDIDKIFSKFQRASNTGKIKGMGLGLYIVKEIVDFHQGSISVESTLGKGATFTLEFPTINR